MTPLMFPCPKCGIPKLPPAFSEGYYCDTCMETRRRLDALHERQYQPPLEARTKTVKIHGFDCDPRRLCNGTSRDFGNLDKRARKPCKLHPMIGGKYCPYHDKQTKKQVNSHNKKPRHKRKAKGKAPLSKATNKLVKALDQDLDRKLKDPDS